MSRRSSRLTALASLFASLLVAASAPAQTWDAPPGPARAQMGGVTLTLGGTVGQVGGIAYERVYFPEVRDFKVSELKWDISNVAVAGLQGQVDFANRFRVNAAFWNAVNEGDGAMIDRDWLLQDTYSDDDWTHESRHPDTSVDSGSVLDLNLEVTPFARGFFSLTGVVGYRRNEWEWTSRGGAYVYSYDRNDDGYFSPEEFRAYHATFPAGQRVITYRQQYEMPYLGVGFEGGGAIFLLQGHLLYSPWVSAEDRDYHFLRDMHYAGDFSGGEWFGADIAATWFLGPAYVNVGVEYQKFDEIVGDVTISGAEGSGFYRDGGGMELETLVLLFGAGVRF